MYRMILCVTAAVLAAVAVQSARADDHSACVHERGGDAIAACGRLLALNPRDATAYNNRGFAYNGKGDHDRAIADLDQAIRLDPKFAGAYSNRGWAYDGKGDYDRAIADLDQAIRLDPRLAGAYNNRGWAYNGKGNYDRAIADLDQAIRLDPKMAVAYHNRGNAYDGNGDHDRAIVEYGQAIRLDREYTRAYNDRGVAYERKGDHERAIADLNQAIGLDPSDAITYNNRANAYNGEGDHDRAIADLDQAIRLDAGKAVIYVTRGEAYEGKNDPGRAMAEFEHALKLDPSLAEARKGRERVQVRMAKGPNPGAPAAAPSGGSSSDTAACRNLNNKDLGQRLEACTRAIAAGGGNRDALFELYRTRMALYAQLGQFDRMVADCDEVIRLDPEDPVISSTAYSLRGFALVRQHEYGRAIADLDKAITLDASQANFYFMRANAHLKMANYPQARADIDKMLGLNPGSVQGYWLRGRYHLEVGDASGVLEDATEGLRRDPHDGFCYALRAEHYLRAGRLAEAQADADSAVASSPRYDGSYAVRGRIALAQGRTEAAVSDLTKAIELDDDKQPAAVAYRGSAYEHAGNTGLATADYRHALELVAASRMDREAQATARQRLAALAQPRPAAPAAAPPAQSAAPSADLAACGNRADKDLQRRVAACTRVIAAAGNNDVLLQARGERAILYAQLKRWERVIGDSDEIMRLAPEGEIRSMAERLRRSALETIRQSLPGTPGRGPATAAAPPADLRECTDRTSNEVARKIAACTGAIVANPKNNDVLLPAYLARATLYQGLKEWDHVIADCDEILRLAPEGELKSAAGILRDAALGAKTPAPAVAQNPAPGSGDQWQSLFALNQRLLEAMKAGDYGLDITRLAEEAVRRSRAAFGDRNPGQTLTAVNNLALLYTEQGRYSEAEPLYLEALQGTRAAKGDRDPSTLTSISNLASLYDAEGRYEESEQLDREALRAQREVLGARHPDTLTTLNNLANLYSHQGRFSEAEPLLVEVLQAQREVQGARDPNTLKSINNLAVLYEEEGRYGEGEQLERAALQEMRETLGARHPSTLTSLSNLALLYWGQRRYEEAEPLFREALQARREVLGVRHPETLTSLNHLAGFYDGQGRFGEAEPLVREVLQTRREVLGARHPDTLQSLDNLAWDSAAQGRFGAAEPLFREALQASREVLGARHPTTLNIVSGLAILYDREGRNGDAEPLYRESLQAGREVLGARHPATLNFQGSFALYLAKVNRTTEAVRLLQEMEPDVLGRIGQELHSTETGTARRRLLSAVAGFQDVALTLGVAPDTSLDARRFAATTVLQFKVLQGEEEAYLARLARRSSDQRVQALVTEIGRLRVTLAALVQGAPEAFAKTLHELEAKQQELVGLSPEYNDRLQVLRAGPDEVRKALPRGSALIEFRQFRPYDFQAKKQGEPRFAAVLLTGNAEPVLADLGPVSELEPLAAALGGGTGGPGPAVQGAPESPPLQATASRGLAPAQQPSQSNEAVVLYQRLLGPFKDAVAAAKTVYVAPDGILNLMPFTRLKLADGRYWFEVQEVHVVQSGRDLLRPGADHAARGMIALGGIDFDAGADAAGKQDSAFFAAARSDRKAAVERTAGVFRIGFPALPATAAEAREVTATFRKRFAGEPAELWSGADARKDRLMALKAPPRVLHLATHGFYLPNQSREPMLLSGIALSGANREVTGAGNDGLLFALEAEGLNLDGTELVVLSACDTAKGTVDYSEGVFGLARALRTAGARNVLVTLWPLDDLLARDFMADFYKNWLNGARSDPARALRDTQLAWIKQAGRSDPGAWAPYVVVE